MVKGNDYGAKAFPDGSDSKEFVCSVGDPGSISGLGRSPGEGNGNLLFHIAGLVYWIEQLFNQQLKIKLYVSFLVAQ